MKSARTSAAAFAWTKTPDVVAILAALNATKPDAARFVGGCVRDSLIGITPKDIDVATVLRPPEVMAALEAAGLRHAPTGLDHGTVTAIADDTVIEVTTLRADVSTDGRRATVAFTDDWAVDATRRDFTINALYRSAAGEIFDPVNGLPDLKAGKVRFIGDASARIREDYLRILRFFRFSARFAVEAYDAEGLAACGALKDGLSRLSAERIGIEMTALLALPEPADALAQMREIGVLAAIWPEDADIASLRRLKTTKPDAVTALALAALWPSPEKGDGLARAFRLANADASDRRAVSKNAPRMASLKTPKDARREIHGMGPSRFIDAVALAKATQSITEEEEAFLTDVAENDAPPSFPLSGKDVVALGIPPGERVGEILKAVEERWTAEDFPSEKRLRELLAEASKSLI